MDEKLITLWHDINLKRKLIITHMYPDNLKPELNIIYNKILSLYANGLCDIMNDIIDIIDVGGQKNLKTVEQHEPRLNEPEQACFISHVSNPVCPSCGTDDIIYRFKTNSFICHKCVDVEWANGC